MPSLSHAQQRVHVITGRVTTDSSAVIVGADVIVTVAPSAETIASKSDSAGRFRVTIANPTGEYLLYVGALGRRPFRQRVTITGGDSAVVNVRLAAAVTTVAGVQVNARRARPTPSLGNDGPPLTPDGFNRIADGLTTALSPDQQGNIDAMASMIPGLSTTSNGVSAFGLGPDANMTTLNGMSFAGADVPRDLATTTTFLTSPWDPTIGGFSGALASVNVARGGNVSRRSARLTLDAPALQVGDPVAAQFGQKFTNLQFGNTGVGAFSLDKYFYNYGLQVSRQTADVSTLLDFDSDALEHAGIAPDSAFRLSQILGAVGVPLTRGGIPSQRTVTSGNFIERFDRALPNPPRDSTPHPSYSVIVGANYTEAAASALSPTSLPATTGKTTVGGGFLQGLYTRYFGQNGDYISETAAGASFNENRGSPYLALPSGNVIVASSLGGDPTFSSLSFGGNSLLARDSKTVSFDIHNQTDFLVNTHASLPAKLYFLSRYDHFDQSIATNRLGAFNFNSLADVASNTPSSFSRTLNIPARSGGEWLGAAALGGAWNAPKLILSGGARVDANVFTGLPSFNATLDSTFGVRNDHAPNSIAVSPRLGFTWYPTAAKGSMILVSPVMRSFRSGYQIHGGIGEFRSFLPSALLSDAIGGTGLPGSNERLTCTGPAAPTPDWQSYLNDPSTIPTSCVGGSSVFADTVPNVALVDRKFAPSKSWRATLGYANTLLGNWINIDGAYSLNLNQPGSLDLNFAGTPQFTLGAEGNRPVFVSPSSIVATTGAASAVESRLSPAFGRVTDRVSDLRSDSKQVTVFVIPNIPFRFGFGSIAYTYSDTRAELRGFDGGTSTDPRAMEWASQAFTPRHQFIVQGAKSLFTGRLNLTAAARVISGLRYTPIVAGDVNGDGWSGDRAFIFDPAKVANPTLANGLRDIMENGSSSARDCLTRQVNTIAGRSSCVGPWSATLNMSLVMPNVPKTNNRVQATVNFANPLGGLDQLLHGSDHLRGWGATPLIDGTLYQVRGFDQTSREYLYQVNPRFGATNPATTTFRTPFRVTLDVRVDYGRSGPEQNLELSMRIKPPLSGTRATVDSIMARQKRAGWSDPYVLMLRFADSLALSRAQSEQIQKESAKLAAHVDSMYRTLAQYLVALPSHYDVSEALSRVTETNNAAWQVNYDEATFIKEILTSAQIRRLPATLYSMVTIPGYKGRFFFNNG